MYNRVHCDHGRMALFVLVGCVSVCHWLVHCGLAAEVAGYCEGSEVHADGQAQKLRGIPRMLSTRAHCLGTSVSRVHCTLCLKKELPTLSLSTSSTNIDRFPKFFY